MRRSELEITDQSELLEIIRAGRYATIALCRDNEPYAVTLSYGHDVERSALYFHCAAEGLKLDFIRANPRACVSVIDDRGYVMTECDHHYRSLILRGEMHLIEDIAEKQHAVDVLLNHLETDPNVVRAKMPIGAEALAKTAFLRFDIREISGKRHL